jgi:hypothetical protein
VGVLSPYATGLADVDLHDGELARQAGELRELLEAVYGRRLTFRGEQREPTGSAVAVRQRLDEVAGIVLGAEGDVESGSLEVDQEAKRVDSGGSITGFSGRIGH